MIDQQKAKEAFDAYLEKAKNDGRIIGIMLAGGRAKGIVSKHSDYDCLLVTTDDGFEGVKKDYPKTEHIDSLPHAISEFREYAKTGVRTQWDKYNFTHATALLDRTGEIQKLIDEKGSLEPEKARSIAHDALGGYLNSLYRSLKNLRDGNEFAAHLDAIETIPRILTFIFAIENRVRPYNKFLAWELENYPLTKHTIDVSSFLAQIKSIADSADIETQKGILNVMRKLAIENGHADEITDWEGHFSGL